MKTRSLPAVLASTVILSTLAAATWAQAPASGPERVDLDAIYRIKEEGLQRSQVMDTVWYLTDVHGPRLTNSPNIRAAAAWAMKRLTSGASAMCARRRGGRSAAAGPTRSSPRT